MCIYTIYLERGVVFDHKQVDNIIITSLARGDKPQVLENKFVASCGKQEAT